MKRSDYSRIVVAQRSLSEPGRTRTVVVVGLAAAYVGFYTFAFLTGGAPPVCIFLNFPLILLAGATLGLPGAVVAATVSGILIGPLLNSFIAIGHLSLPIGSTSRLLSFEFFGLFTGGVFALLHYQAGVVSETTRRFMHAQKMEAVGQLAAGIAHDFNNVLTVVVGFAEVALSSVDSEHPAHRSLSQVLDAAHRGASLSHQLLAFSRRQILQPSTLNLNDVIRDLKSMLDRIAGDAIAVSSSLDSSLYPIDIDLSQLEQVIMNLAVNAHDAITGPGEIVLATRNVELTKNHPHFRPEISPGRYVQLSVTDTGSGMSPDVASHVFEPFFTSKSHGTGLGLSTIYGIVKQSRGYVYVHTQEGAGTTFNLFFPAADTEASVAAPAAGPPVDALGGDQTLLVVEDEEEIATLMESVLTTHGYTVDAQPDAELALKSYDDCETTLDLLVTDIDLPGLDGIQLSRRLSSGRPNLRTLFVTGYGPQYDPPPIESDGRSAILQKPYGSKDLLLAVRSLLAPLVRPDCS